jgi:hypothetical protein
MTKTTLITILLFSIGLVVFGQDNFDYHTDFKSILEQSQDSTSSNYYPDLLNRFEENDSTLTVAELLALQIGFTANSNYKPYETITTEREIKSLIGQKKYEDAILVCDKLLKTNPVNFTALMEKSFSYMKLGKESSEFHKEKFMKLLKSVMASGSGTYENAYFVLSPIDGQTMITHIFGGSIGTMGSGADPNGYFVDILEMNKEGKDSITLYFNINHATDNMFSEDDLKKMEESIKKKKKKKNK